MWPYKDLTQQTLIAIGYGQTKFGKRSDVSISKYILKPYFIHLIAGPTSNTLLKVYLNEITNEKCSAYYRKDEKLKQGIHLGHICAIDTQAKMDTCQVQLLVIFFKIQRLLYAIHVAYISCRVILVDPY